MVKLRFETDLATSLQASNDLANAVNKVGNNLSIAAKEARSLEVAAKRIVDQNLSSQEKYNQKLETMAKAVRAGTLSMEDAEKTAARLRQRLDETAGPSTIANITKMAAGYLSVSGAVATVLRGLQDVESQAQATADRVLNSVGAFGELQQVATSPEDFQKLVGQARNLQRRGVFGPDQGGQAADFVFALRNAGYSDEDVGFITGLGESKKVKPENLQKVAEGLKKYQTIFGAKEAGSIKDVAQKVFAAAGTMQTDFAQAAGASTLFGSEAAALGYSDEEALAAFVAIEQQSPGAEEAATRLRSMLTQIQKKKLSKGSLSATIAHLVGKVRGGKSAIDLLDETRAAAGLNILAGDAGQAMFAQQVPSITGAPAQDVIGQRAFLNVDPQLRAASTLQVTQGEATQKMADAVAEKEMLFDIIRASRTRSANTTAGWLDAWIQNYIFGGAIDFMGMENLDIRGAAQGRYGVNKAEQQLMIDYLKRISENTGGGPAPKPSGRQE